MRTLVSASVLLWASLALADGPSPPAREPAAAKRPPASAAAPRPALAAGADAGAAPGAASTDVAAVLAPFARLQALSAKFHEEKRMALLSQPLSSEGSLDYQKPRLLARHTRSPHAGSVLLRGQTLSFGDAKHSESLELSAQPAVRVLVDTFVNVLGGDLAALKRVAEVSAESTPDGGFRLHVAPTDEKMKKLVRSMSFEGKGALLSRMELLDANGDTTVTTFSAVSAHPPFSAAEQARIFRIGQ